MPSDRIDSHGLERDIAEILLETGYDREDLLYALARAARILDPKRGVRTLISILDND
jgi:hypothetical protein